MVTVKKSESVSKTNNKNPTLEASILNMTKSGKSDANIISEISKSRNVSESKSDDMEEKLVKESSTKESDTVKEIDTEPAKNLKEACDSTMKQVGGTLKKNKMIPENKKKKKKAVNKEAPTVCRRGPSQFCRQKSS